MSDDTARLPPFDKKLRDEFREHVKEKYGGIRGHYRREVERMVRDWLAQSDSTDLPPEMQQIQQELDDLRDQVETVSEGKTKKDSISETTKNRMRSINEQISRESGESNLVHESVINRAIEDHAGSSEPTLRRYKEMLQSRKLAFKNPLPDTDTWFLDAEVFVNHVEGHIHQLEDSLYEFEREYGEEWWAEMSGDDESPSFQ